VYDQFEERINKASDKFLSDDVTDRIKTYTANGLIKKDLFGDTYTVKGIQLPMKKNISLEVLRNQLSAMSANYMINNIELHKLIYSDPYLYKDELKRIKSFSSPRQSAINSSVEWNAKANEIANQEYKNKKDIGYTDMIKDHLNSIVLEDNISVNEALKYE
jgi:predicted DNA-binding protein